MKQNTIFHLSLSLVMICVFLSCVHTASCQPSLLILDLGWDEENNCWYTPEPIYEQESFMVQVWNDNMTMRIENATIIFATFSGEYTVSKTDEYGQAYFTAPDTEEKIERCTLYVSAPDYINTSRITYIHNQGIWKLKCAATSSTIDVNGKTKLFNVSKYWKIEWDYVARRDDCCLRIMAIRPEGNLFFYHIIFDNRRSSGTLYGRGAMNNIRLDVFAGRINSWNVKVYTHA